MKRVILAVVALVMLAGGAGDTVAETATQDCTVYCGKLAAKKCDDVASSKCNAYIVGCLAGCGIAHL